MDNNDRFEIRLLASAIILTTMVLFGISILVYKSYEASRYSRERSVKLGSLRGTIVHLDEVLTMSARIAAAMNETKWEARYLQYEPILDKAITQAIALVPHLWVGSTAMQTDIANKKLVEMEKQSFAFVRAGKSEKAKFILFSTEYERQKLIYSVGMDKLNEMLEQEMNISAQQEKERAMVGILIVAAVSLSLVVVWILVVQATRRRRRKSEELSRLSQELQELNQTLEQKVVEGTKELNTYQSRLLQAQKMDSLGNMAGGIAHDLNNQLTPVCGYLDLVLKKTKLDTENHDLLDKAYQAAARSTHIVQRLLSFSKPSTQKMSSLKVEDLIDEIKGMLPQILPATIKLKIQCDANLWDIYGNETELQTVLVNLIMNARDAMPDGGELKISVNNVDGVQLHSKKAVASNKIPYVMFTVKDNGTGISPEVLSRMYEPFFTTKNRAEGTGLGLAMAFNIIKAHSGWIDASTELGHGTAFQIYLPAYFGESVEDIASSQSVSTTTAKLPSEQSTILFVDDEEMIREMGKILLKHLGYSVILAVDGIEAVNIYKERQSEIKGIVSDMTMPNLTGREMLGKILEINPRAKVILSSGFTNEGDAENLVAAGALAFMQKPYTISKLSDLLNKYIN